MMETPEPQKRPMTVEEPQAKVLPLPNCRARRRRMEDGMKSVKPMRSRSGMTLRTNARLKGGFNVSSAMGMRKSRIAATPPIGRLM
jgi:hypothetical protein